MPVLPCNRLLIFTIDSILKFFLPFSFSKQTYYIGSTTIYLTKGSVPILKKKYKMITISEKAIKMLRRQGAGEKTFVRVLVKSGGCAGMTYDAEIDSLKKDNERVVLTDRDITIISNAESLGYLEGLHIDYSDDLISAGFRFNNNNNESSCGCGASFALSGFPELTKGGLDCGH